MSHIMGRGGRGDVVTSLIESELYSAGQHQTARDPLSHPTLALTLGSGGILAKWFDKMSCLPITNQMFLVLIFGTFSNDGEL